MTHKLIIYVHLNYLIATFASVTHFMLNLFQNLKSKSSTKGLHFIQSQKVHLQEPQQQYLLQIFTSVSKQNLAQILYF